jgi:hypothetical protein
LKPTKHETNENVLNTLEKVILVFVWFSLYFLHPTCMPMDTVWLLVTKFVSDQPKLSFLLHAAKLGLFSGLFTAFCILKPLTSDMNQSISQLIKSRLDDH